MPLKKKSKSFLIERSLLSALDKNKKEAKNLDAYCLKLDRELDESCFKIEKQNLENYKFLQNLKQDRLNVISKLTENPINKETIYFDLMKAKTFDTTNSYLPDLIKSLRDQELRSVQTVQDLVDYNLHKKVDYSILNKNNKIELKKNDANLLNNKNNINETKRTIQLNRCHSSYSRLNTNRPDTNLASALSFKSLNTFKNDYYNNYDYDSFGSFKSIRRERQSAKDLNSEHDKKLKILQYNRNNNLFASICSKRCHFFF